MYVGVFVCEECVSCEKCVYICLCVVGRVCLNSLSI